MRKLPLYPNGIPYAAAAVDEIVSPTPQCRRCHLSESSKARTPCLHEAPTSNKDLLYVVGEKPSRLEDTARKAFYGQASSQVRTEIESRWRGNVMFDYAIRCSSPPMTPVRTSKAIDACRAYTSHAIATRSPTRILCLGPEAAYSVLGRRVPTLKISKVYGWCQNVLGDPIPVFVLANPSIVYRNPFTRKEFNADLAWALKTEVSLWYEKTFTYLVSSEQDALDAYNDLSKSPWITYDVETHGRPGNKDFRIESATLLSDGSGYSYTWTRESFRDEGALHYLSLILSDAHLATQNGKYDDRSVMAVLKTMPKRIYYDTRLGHKLLYPDHSAKLEVLAETVGMGGHKDEAYQELKQIKAELNRQAKALSPDSKKPKKPKDPLFYVPKQTLEQINAGIEPDAFAYGYLESDLLYRYNARDVFSTREVTVQERQVLLDHPTISRAWNHVVRGANAATRWIEYWGFPVDRSAVVNLASFCDMKIHDVQKKMRKHTDINPASPKQLAQYLFEDLGLQVSKQTKSGAFSTDESVLELLKDQHEYVSLLLEHRKLSKFSGTYAHGLLKHICADGRVHPSFLLDGAGTGRLSCQDPNMQNIPRAKGNVLGKMARDCFVAKPGWVIIELDYSQLELRIAAMLSGDQAMIEDFKRGLDIHRNGARECCSVAWNISQKAWDAMSKDEQDPYRSQIKTIIFGKLYGKTIGSIAKEFKTSKSVIEKIDARIWGRYSKLNAFMHERINESRRTGVAWTWWDGERARVRPIPKILDHEQSVRSHYERTAGNTCVQGSAADYATASLAPTVDWLLTDKKIKGAGELVSTVHDALLLHVKEDKKKYAGNALREIMLSHNSMGVPLDVEGKWGTAWGSMEDLKVG